MIEELNYAQRERLAYIDFCLEYFGKVSRTELIEKFQTGLASCSRDLAMYRELSPTNAVLAHETKKYIRSSQFKPIFEHDPEAILTALAKGFGDGISSRKQPSSVCFDATRLIHPEPSIISAIMRAIHSEKPIECQYESISSGTSTRTLLPHAIVNNGHRWHVRAFDRKSKNFRDFVCSRFTYIKQLDSTALEHETQSKDQDWNNIIELQIIPNPSLRYSKAIELDYKMDKGMLVLEVRSALAGYLLRQWNVDCSTNGELEGSEYQLRLKNANILQGCSSASVAPGFKILSKGNL